MKKAYFQILMTIAGMLMALAIMMAPAQGQTVITKPTRNRTTATFTMSENASPGVLSGPSLGMSHSQDLHYAVTFINGVTSLDWHWWYFFKANNQSKNSNSDFQPVTIRYNDSSGSFPVNYEGTPILSGSRRGWVIGLTGCPLSAWAQEHCETISVTIYVEDVPELNTMSGSIRVTTDSTTNSMLVGDTLTADFSGIRDQEGVNNFYVLWSQEVCPDSRGLGTWNVGQIIEAGTSYQLRNSDLGQVVSVWGQYKTDNNNYKWVCKDVLSSVEAPPPPVDTYPTASTDEVTYEVNENTSQTISQTLQMNDREMSTIRYNIVSLDGDAVEQRELRSIFSVRNMSPNPMSSTSQQPIELSNKINFNYEETPDVGDPIEEARGYEFGIEGCDPANQCITIRVTVHVQDVPEISLSSGQVAITGQFHVGALITANFSGFSDPEANDISRLYNGFGDVQWRRGACKATYGTGTLPATQSSGDSYKNLENGYSYRIKPTDLGSTISFWGQYYTVSGGRKWVCKQIGSSVRDNPSWPNIYMTSSRYTVPKFEKIEVTLWRTNINLSSQLEVSLRRNQSANNTSVTFTKTFPANEDQVTFEVTAWTQAENLKVEVLPNEGYNHSSAFVTATVTPPNQGPAGNLIITGTAQVGETLTADASGITDGNGISRSFSYTWWKQVNFGPKADVEEQISGARSSTYQIRREDVRAKIWAKVHYTDNDGFNERRTSDFTAKIIPVADEAPYVLSMHLVDNRGSFIAPGSRIEVSEGHSFDVRVFMSKNVTGITSLHYAPRMRLQIGGRTRTLPWYTNVQCNFLSPGPCPTSTSELKFFHTIEAGDTGTITFPTNGMFISNGQGETNPTPPSGANFVGTDLNYPRKNLGYVTALASQQQVIEEPEEPVTPPTPPPVETNVTASFQDLPVEHDGSSQFTFRVKTSEVLRPRSKRSIKDALTVTNSSIQKVRKVGSQDNWRVTVQPSSTAAVSISFAPKTNCSDVLAPCTSDDRAVSSLLSAQVMGPALLSINDASAYENTDTSMSFSVTLNRPATQTVTVNWATANGTAMAGSDYTASSGTLTFSQGESTKTITVAILNDSIDEGSETFFVNLSNASGGQIADNQGIGTINNTDAMPGAWLSRFGRTVGAQAVDAISSRMGAPAENRVVIGGVEMSGAEDTIDQQNFQEPFESHWQNGDDQKDANNRSMTLEELAHGTSFNLSGENKSTGKSWSAWGNFASDNFEGKAGDVDLEGKVTSAFLGADLASGNWRGGVAVSNSKAEGTYNSGQDNGNVESNLTSVYPYLGYEFGENNALWGILGLGEGDVTVTQRDQSIKTDTSMRMGAGGAKSPILSQSEGDEMNMTLQTDGMYVQMNSEETKGMESSRTEVKRLRLSFDSSKDFNVEEGTLTPSVQLGVRHDSGDAEEGMGVEAGAKLRYVSGKLTFEGAVKKLLVHEDDKYEDWGASAVVRIDSDKSGKGLSLNIAPTWGTASNNVDRLWSSEELHNLQENGDFEASEQLNAEISYGLWKPLSFLHGLVTPYLGFSLSDNSNTYRTGTRWNIHPNATMKLEMDRTEQSSGDEEDTLMLRGSLIW